MVNEKHKECEQAREETFLQRANFLFSRFHLPMSRGLRILEYIETVRENPESPLRKQKNNRSSLASARRE